jgi:hypothetical protein
MQKAFFILKTERTQRICYTELVKLLPTMTYASCTRAATQNPQIATYIITKPVQTGYQTLFHAASNPKQYKITNRFQKTNLII